MVYAALGWDANLWCTFGTCVLVPRNPQEQGAERIANMFFAYTCTHFSHSTFFWLLSPSGVSTRIQVAWLPIKITASKLEPAHRNSNREGEEEPAANEDAGTPETLCQLMPADAS